MNQSEATHLIRDLFEQPFDEARFTRFVRELLNEIDESKATRPIAGQYIPLSFRDHVQQYRRIATYTDPDTHDDDANADCYANGDRRQRR